jgi:hypothetical protein
MDFHEVIETRADTNSLAERIVEPRGNAAWMVAPEGSLRFRGKVIGHRGTVSMVIVR